MKCLKRNKRPFSYALYEGVRPGYAEDEYGNQLETGEPEVIYSAPIPYKANISPAQGEAVTQQFGDTEIYDKVIVVDDTHCPICKSSILWVDSLDTAKAHDYVVKKVAKSLNSISYAISKVSLS